MARISRNAASLECALLTFYLLGERTFDQNRDFIGERWNCANVIGLHSAQRLSNTQSNKGKLLMGLKMKHSRACKACNRMGNLSERGFVLCGNACWWKPVSESNRRQ